MTWGLSTGRCLNSAPEVYLVDLEFVAHAVVVSTEIAEDLDLNELIEMLALIRRSPERIDRSSGKSFLTVLNDVGAEQPLNEWRDTLLPEAYIMPLVSVLELHPWPDSAEQFLASNPLEVPALINMWINERDLLKRPDPDELMRADSHPFIDTCTFHSGYCTVQYHFTTFAQAASLKGASYRYAALREWRFLSALLIVVGLQRVLLERDIVELRQVPAGGSPTQRVTSGRALRQLQRVIERHSARLRRIYENETVWLTRRDHMDNVLAELRHKHLVNRLTNTVSSLTADLVADLQAAYAARVQTLALVVSAIALIIAVVALVVQFAPLL